MKYDLEALQTQVKSKVEKCSKTLEKAKQAATGLEAPSDFKYISELQALPNDIGNIMNGIKNVDSWVDKKIADIVDAELKNLKTLQSLGIFPDANLDDLYSILAIKDLISGQYQLSGNPMFKGSKDEIEKQFREIEKQFRERYGGEVGVAVFLSVAKENWQYVCDNVKKYGGGVNIPLKSNEKIDCSSFVSQVLYEYGKETNNQALVDEFEGMQHNTETLKTVDWEKCGFETQEVDWDEDVTSKLKKGDILDRSIGAGGSGHVQIVAEIKDGIVYVYDCGDSSRWVGNPGKPVISDFSTSVWTKATGERQRSRPGIIIRKKND